MCEHHTSLNVSKVEEFVVVKRENMCNFIAIKKCR